jgi:hypothetical protein
MLRYVCGDPGCAWWCFGVCRFSFSAEGSYQHITMHTWDAHPGNGTITAVECKPCIHHHAMRCDKSAPPPPSQTASRPPPRRAALLHPPGPPASAPPG